MIGQYPDDNGQRDAFHIACVAVSCDTSLEPGESIKFAHYGRGEVESCSTSERQGIVDPMLTERVPSGQTFWMCLNPKSTRKLTHSFEIDGEPSSDEDEDDMIACRQLGCG